MSTALGGGHRKIACFADDAAARPFLSRKAWYACALRASDVQLHVIGRFALDWGGVLI